MVALSGGHEVRKGGEVVAVSQADVLAKTFSWEEVTFTLKRMASARDKGYVYRPSPASGGFDRVRRAAQRDDLASGDCRTLEPVSLISLLY
jgi:hypothetical protein